MRKMVFGILVGVGLIFTAVIAFVIWTSVKMGFIRDVIVPDVKSWICSYHEWLLFGKPKRRPSYTGYYSYGGLYKTKWGKHV